MEQNERKEKLYCLMLKEISKVLEEMQGEKGGGHCSIGITYSP